MLILAGVTIAAISGNNGILQNAARAKVETEQATEEELKKLTQTEAAMHFEEYEYTDINGTKVNIPAKCAISQVEGENSLEYGLVIIDVKGNEWVCVEVPKSEMPEGLKFENETDYTAAEAALKTYASDYIESEFTDKWYEGCGLEENEYIELKQKMLKSIYENGGFYIGRYETGSFNNPVTSNDITREAVIQKGAYPYNFVTIEQAQEISKNLAIEDKTCSPIFGIQWNLTCKFLEKSVLTPSQINNDSKGWGNYNCWGDDYDKASIVLSNGKYSESPETSNQWLDIIPGTRTYRMLVTTGASEMTRKMNIYDFAGNTWEWTLEWNNDIGSPSTVRGGSFAYNGTASASHRNRNPISSSIEDIGFRTTLY